jgi:hypothetical protein
MKTCIISDCKKSHYARGLCHGHYQRWKRGITLERPWKVNKSEILEYLEKILLTDLIECILWPFGQSHGYAMVSKEIASTLLNKRINHPTRIHNIICELKHGPSPEGKPQAAHDCANRLCINWNHIQWRSNQENSNNPITKSRMSISAKTRHQHRGSNGRFI